MRLVRWRKFWRSIGHILRIEVMAEISLQEYSEWLASQLRKKSLAWRAECDRIDCLANAIEERRLLDKPELDALYRLLFGDGAPSRCL